ncbi:WD repeat-containing protein 20-like, partial [Phlebotomus argentipes]|uniref:WD repeat-containing protein 20-like n=1 Tax=Phlebotomus argentipes TaxID=94469 RepID=UPI002892C8AE
RLIDKTKVTCLKWLPSSPNLFLAAHASGHLYLYNEELPCTPTAPNYQQFKMGEGFVIYTCKSKSTRNPLYKWSFGTDNGSINEISFSPCGSNLAIVSQDGFLRVFHYDTMELLGIARSYFGGFLCVCWSPDGKYIVVGGEDDLVTVWSMQERRVVARGQGHRSWVSVVAFDPYTTSYSHWDGPDFSDDENPINDGGFRNYSGDDNDAARRPPSSATAADKMATSYRLGSVSQDTQLCLWDITEDVLRQPVGIRHRLSSHDPQQNLVNGEAERKGASSSASGSSVSSTSAAMSTVSSGASRDVDNPRPAAAASGKIANSVASDSAPVATNSDSKHWNSVSGKSGKSVSVIGNCVGNSVKSTDSPDSKNGSSKSSDGMSAFNTLTQRLSHLGFGSDKASSHHHGKKTFSLSKSSANHHFVHNNNSASSPGDSASIATSGKTRSGGGGAAMVQVATNGNGAADGDGSSGGSSVVATYDPMKLIGTSACPRFDECPVLEPLVCKKIAHERLTALIFREDCFLTACQDGIIYTWARPGFANAPQHAGSSPSAPPGGTVV